MPTPHGEREIDFLVAWPGVGLAVLEVKGGHVERDEDGQCWSSRGQERKSLDLSPMDQASEVRYLLKDWLLAQATAGRARIQHLVVLPHTNIQDVRRQRLPPRAGRRRQAHDDQADAASAMRSRRRRPRPLDPDDLDQLCRAADAGDEHRRRQRDAAEAEEHADRLGRELADRVAEWHASRA